LETGAFSNQWIFTWIVVPFLIFLARVLDVSIGTIRIIYVSRGKKLSASLLGFFEVLVWILAITQILKNLSNPLYYIAYAGGFATGNFVGIYLEGKFAVGLLSVHIFTKKGVTELLEHFRVEKYGVTSRISEGIYGKVRELFMIIKRKNAAHIIEIVREYDPEAFISIQDVRAISGGMFPYKHGKRKDEDEGDEEHDSEKIDGNRTYCQE